jgi:hypothetical protein
VPTTAAFSKLEPSTGDNLNTSLAHLVDGEGITLTDDPGSRATVLLVSHSLRCSVFITPVSRCRLT